MNLRYRKAVFMVVYAKNKNKIKYLVMRRKLHWSGWEFPKGGINPDESKRAAVKRETMEETGRKALKIRRFNFHGKYKFKRKFSDLRDFMGQSYSLYSVEIKYGKIKLDPREHSEYKWLSFEDALKKVRFPNQKKSLKIVDKWLRKK